MLEMNYKGHGKIKLSATLHLSTLGVVGVVFPVMCHGGRVFVIGTPLVTCRQCLNIACSHGIAARQLIA